MMPALTGGELASLVRRRKLNTGIILHSSKPIAELQEIVRETGALGAVTKTFGEYLFNYEVIRLVRRYLQGDAELCGGNMIRKSTTRRAASHGERHVVDVPRRGGRSRRQRAGHRCGDALAEQTLYLRLHGLWL